MSTLSHRRPNRISNIATTRKPHPFAEGLDTIGDVSQSKVDRTTSADGWKSHGRVGPQPAPCRKPIAVPAEADLPGLLTVARALVEEYHRLDPMNVGGHLETGRRFLEVLRRIAAIDPSYVDELEAEFEEQTEPETWPEWTDADCYTAPTPSAFAGELAVIIETNPTPGAPIVAATLRELSRELVLLGEPADVDTYADRRSALVR